MPRRLEAGYHSGRWWPGWSGGPTFSRLANQSEQCEEFFCLIVYKVYLATATLLKHLMSRLQAKTARNMTVIIVEGLILTLLHFLLKLCLRNSYTQHVTSTGKSGEVTQSLMRYMSGVLKSIFNPGRPFDDSPSIGLPSLCCYAGVILGSVCLARTVASSTASRHVSGRPGMSRCRGAY